MLFISLRPMSQQSTQAPSSAAVSVSPATAGSFVLFVAFFLPWINLLGTNVAGFDLHKVWEPGRFAWVIPAAALGAVVLGLLRRQNVALAQLAGGIPFVLLALALFRYGGDVFQAIAVGGYITLLCGFFLLCVVPRMGSKAQSA